MAERAPFRPKQSLGQNFMHDPNMIRKIVGALQAPPDAHVVEIGPGTGALTGLLNERYDTFTALEIDQRAVAYLNEHLPAVDVRETDALEANWAALAEEKGGPLYVISNTPYYLTSQILFVLLDARSVVQEAVLTMQKEVAERLVAKPRTKAYGILSVLMQLYANPEYLFSVSRHVFTPQPNVTSAAVRCTYAVDDEPEVDFDWMRTLVRAAFNQRRKMLRNSLSLWTKDQDLTLPNDWGRRRAEALSPSTYIDLAAYLDEQAAPRSATE
ncbi:ribosomal RNA small subunit methyltransferase A [Longimonas halophila]|uniref:Ribosomal RNA small subunit methyltransferase A n=1 Tax=Longimonas halophila TaxID=1469170 RepID=A0A2H3NJR8_9BACT|nr:16S rRNA (adenine(1518)-N(6)/adenine(1519)-N(6))-dimethyltransferase RsmA [Longimonas halophila]PEN05964.1 ribosomal RNA small subunit methyltransferase A [Longimonas halophila]